MYTFRQRSQGGLREYPVEVGNAVMQALFILQENYWDSDGEYTSKGRVGDVCSEVWRLLDRQWALEHPNIDKKAARGVLVGELAGMSRSISAPPGDTAETAIKFESKGKGGTRYYLEITIEVASSERFDMLGKTYSDATCQILFHEECLSMSSIDVG